MSAISVLKQSRVDDFKSVCVIDPMSCCGLLLDKEQKQEKLFKLDCKEDSECNIQAERYICGKLQER